MDYKVKTFAFFVTMLSTLESNGQKYYCNYSNPNDSAGVYSEACVYNKMYSYSQTDTLAKQLITRILSVISLPVNFAIEPCDGINTCRAFVFDNGLRYIFYDRPFISKLLRDDKNNWRLLAILSHELGHHLCGHTLLKSDIERHRMNELQADEFTGAMLARMGANENEAILSLLSVNHPTCAQEPYDEYPCLDNRKKAVLRGFRTITPENRNTNFSIAKNLDKIDISNIESPVRDQGSDATIVGFSVAYAIEYEVKIKYNYFVQISPRYIYNSIGGTGSSGASIEDALEFVKTRGAIEESIWPYAPGDYNNNKKKITADSTSNRYKIKDYYKLPDGNIDYLKRILNQGKSIVAGIKITEYFLQDLSGRWHLKDDKDVAGAFLRISICIVGFDDKTQTFKFKNSWGRNWGDKGYGYLTYDDFKKLVTSAYYIEM